MVERRRLHTRVDEVRAARATRFAGGLADALHELGLTHKALALELGVTHHSVDSWTRGADPTIPGDANLQRLCALLDERQPGLGRKIAGLAGYPWKPAGAPPTLVALRPTELPGAPPTNLPLQLTSFVGRARAVAEVGALLGAQRLLTLVGAGGIGKTRLAVQVAADLAPRFPQGVWFVDLAPLTDPELVPQTVARALGVREQTDQGLLRTLVEHLRAKHLLLLLDNCEHLVAACATLATTLLQGSARLHILATSREALRIGGEVIWRVPPLALPATAQEPVTRLADCEALRLFMERATVHQPQVALTEENKAAVVQICRRLDGVPLALELAAACTRFLPLDQIAARLDNRFHLLTDGSRAVLPRHQTLHAAISWSYEMLAAPEQLLFERLAVFAGGWTLEAAEAVCTDAALRAGQVLELLKRLVDTSLVLVEAESLGGGYRYGMLETLRAYGREQLAAHAAMEAVQARHAQYYVALAEQSEPALRGPQQTAWLERLEQEHDNLRAALEWLHTTGEVEGELRLAGALWRFWYLHDYLSEGRRWLEAALAPRSPTAAPAGRRGARGAGARGQALHGAGTLAYVQGEYAQARALFQEALALRRKLHDPWGISETLSNLGLLLYGQQDYDQAQQYYEEALALRQELNDPWGVGHALSYLAMIVHSRGDYARARALLEQSLVLLRGLGRGNAIAGVLTSLGQVTLYWGDVARAQAAYAEGLVLCRQLGQKRCIATCVAGLAAVAGAQGRPTRAARLFGAAEALRAIIGAQLQPVDRDDYDRQVAAIQAQGDAAAWERAWAEGRALPLEQAIAYALEDPTAPEF